MFQAPSRKIKDWNAKLTPACYSKTKTFGMCVGSKILTKGLGMGGGGGGQVMNGSVVHRAAKQRVMPKHFLLSKT